MQTVKDTINAKIAGKKVVVYSKLGCPFCTMAKDVLKKYSLSGADYEVIEMGGTDCGEMQDYLLQLTGGRTVPRVFINGKCIGGGSETKALHDSGKLKALLA
jgi:glutaredoxin 3